MESVAHEAANEMENDHAEISESWHDRVVVPCVAENANDGVASINRVVETDHAPKDLVCEVENENGRHAVEKDLENGAATNSHLGAVTQAAAASEKTFRMSKMLFLFDKFSIIIFIISNETHSG